MNIEKIIAENQNLIYKIIIKYRSYFDLDDLYQVAVLGLIKAYKNYDASYNTKFMTYAYPYILGEVVKYVSEFKSIKVDRRTRILYYKILKAKELLTQKNMHTPSLNELATYLEMTPSMIESILKLNQHVSSLDAAIDEDNSEIALYNTIGYNDNAIDNYELIDVINSLSDIDKTIIMDRYFLDMTQSEIGKKLGMYQVEVSRREQKILRYLRNNVTN